MPMWCILTALKLLVSVLSLNTSLHLVVGTVHDMTIHWIYVGVCRYMLTPLVWVTSLLM